MYNQYYNQYPAVYYNQYSQYNYYQNDLINNNGVSVSNNAASVSEEKPTGGVSAILDYDLDSMSKFITWVTLGLFKKSAPLNSNFEGLIKSVLSATRLPKSTIILSLNYLNERFQSSGDYFTIDEIFLKLCISLILANKFNDDNTFSNKSWSGATGLDLLLINNEERKWLFDINWGLNSVNFDMNLKILDKCWSSWLLNENSTYNYNNNANSTYNNYNQQPIMNTPPMSIHSHSNSLVIENQNTNNHSISHNHSQSNGFINYSANPQPSYNYNNYNPPYTPTYSPTNYNNNNIWNSNYYNYYNYYNYNSNNSYTNYNLAAC